MTSSPLQRKILALTLLLFLIWIIVGSIIVPVFAYFSDRNDQIDMLQNRAVQYQRIIDQEPMLAAQMEHLTAADIPDLLYHGATEADLNAQLQGDIRELFSQANAQMDDMRSLSGSEEDGFQTINLRMSLRIEMDAFANLLQMICSHHKIIDFENISIKVDRRQDENTPPLLQIEWQVIGFGLISEVENL